MRQVGQFPFLLHNHYKEKFDVAMEHPAHASSKCIHSEKPYIILLNGHSLLRNEYSLTLPLKHLW